MRDEKDLSQECIHVENFSHIFLSFSAWNCLFLTDIWISSLSLCASRGKVASRSHAMLSLWLIESEWLIQALALSSHHSPTALYHSASLNLLLDTVHWPWPSSPLCHHVCLQHCWQCGRELWYGKRVWGLGEQRRSQLCGQICCPLHWQGVHRERSNTGTHQEPAQYDPRYSTHADALSFIQGIRWP